MMSKRDVQAWLDTLPSDASIFVDWDGESLKSEANGNTLDGYLFIGHETEEQGPSYQCRKGGLHEWGIDGQHSNEFCKKCFKSRKETIWRSK
jgi:hypothetical protein